MFVGLESVLQGERFIVANEGEDPISARLLGQCLGVGVPVQHGMLVAVADVGGAGTGTPPAGLGEALHPRLGIDRCLFVVPLQEARFFGPIRRDPALRVSGMALIRGLVHSLFRHGNLWMSPTRLLAGLLLLLVPFAQTPKRK